MDVNAQIIQNVKKFPQLYQRKSHPTERQKIWQILAKNMKLDEQFLKSRWYILREHYVKDLRLHHDETRKKRSNFKYGKLMEFIREHVAPPTLMSDTHEQKLPQNWLKPEFIITEIDLQIKPEPNEQCEEFIYMDMDEQEVVNEEEQQQQQPQLQEEPTHDVAVALEQVITYEETHQLAEGETMQQVATALNVSAESILLDTADEQERLMHESLMQVDLSEDITIEEQADAQEVEENAAEIDDEVEETEVALAEMLQEEKEDLHEVILEEHNPHHKDSEKEHVAHVENLQEHISQLEKLQEHEQQAEDSLDNVVEAEDIEAYDTQAESLHTKIPQIGDTQVEDLQEYNPKNKLQISQKSVQKKLMSQRIRLQKTLPQKTLPEKVEKAQKKQDNLISQKTMSKASISQQSQKTLSQKTLPQETRSQVPKTSSEMALADASLPQKLVLGIQQAPTSLPKENLSQKTLPQKLLSTKQLSQKPLPQSPLHQKLILQSSSTSLKPVSQNPISKQFVSQHTMPQKSVGQQKSTRQTTVTPKSTSPKPISAPAQSQQLQNNDEATLLADNARVLLQEQEPAEKVIVEPIIIKQEAMHVIDEVVEEVVVEQEEDAQVEEIQQSTMATPQESSATVAQPVKVSESTTSHAAPQNTRCEDAIFGELVAAMLKTMETNKKKGIKKEIMNLLLS